MLDYNFIYHLIPSAKEFMFSPLSVSLLVGLFVSKITQKQISTKCGGRKQYGTDQGLISEFYFYFWENNSWILMKNMEV